MPDNGTIAVSTGKLIFGQVPSGTLRLNRARKDVDPLQADLFANANGTRKKFRRGKRAYSSECFILTILPQLGGSFASITLLKTLADWPTKPP